MSTDAESRRTERTISLGGTGRGRNETGRTVGPGAFRTLALGCVLVLLASIVSVLQDVTRVVGGTDSLFVLAGTMLLAATLLARLIRPRTATIAAVTAASLGFAYYLEASGVGVGVVLSATESLLADVVTLVTGLSLLRTVEASALTLGLVPAPVFLSWYLALRGRYALSVLPGGFTLCFLVLTGDADLTITLVGTLAALGTVGFGELERRGGSIAQADLLAVLFALIIVLSLSVTFVPGNATGPVTLDRGGPSSLEGAIDSAGQRSGFTGQVDLSPEVRFTVESEQASYWRTGVYDRFTGDEWVRSGQLQSLNGPITSPPGEYDVARQVVTAETELGVMPVAPQPLSVSEGAAQYAEVTRHGQVHPSTTLIEDDSYVVESAIIDSDPASLKQAGTDYPDEIEEYYLQLPEGTSSEFDDRTATVTEDADTPYETAATIESYLRSSKGYSLDIEQPNGNVAEEFLLEMDEGYCIYFATTMTQMLRAEDIPARYVTGYTSGQQVDDNTHVVRGLDAHAWVEVYFPDHGWVSFDPTPGGERDDVHMDRLQEARENGHENVDTDESEDVPIRNDSEDDPGNEPSPDPNEPSPPDNGTDPTDPTDPNNSSDPNGTNSTDPTRPDPGTPAAQDGDGEDDDTNPLAITIPREFLAFTAVAIVGLAAAIHRTGGRELYFRTIGLYWQRRHDDPARDTERAYRRLERLFEREFRPRRPGESPRAYVSALEAQAATTLPSDRSAESGSQSQPRSQGDPQSRSDVHSDSQTHSHTYSQSPHTPAPTDPRVEHVLACYEQAVYGTGVTPDDAATAIEFVDELARERLPFVSPSSDTAPDADRP
ncbi:transglutaminase family protein [Natrialba aegyptia]|uniref:Transglutaminase n=1 Tax=Natrialba aegyptia DSM 13077 TaxID=1227491 RepID=M0BKN5_9EURY|nr:DUF3488 and transglutaminase-like domain-containing protein [Natrialba aegyptia]ELZ11451.1 transglutaminase [Natrialba aegyptia DSM 13077]